MLKYSEDIKKILLTNLEKNNSINPKNMNNRITSKYLTLILELMYLNDFKIKNIIVKEFSEDELTEYSKNFLNMEISEGFDKEQIRRVSQRTGVNTDERKTEYKRRVTELFELILKMISGDIEAYQEFSRKYEEYCFNREITEFKGMQKYIPLGVLILLSRNKENPLDLTNYEKSCVRNLDYYVARVIVSDIRHEIACLLGLKERRKNTSDLINNVKQIVDDSTSIEDEVEENLESIRLERDQYKSSLQLIQKNLDELSEKLKEESESLAQDTIKEFFVTLNSAKYGNFLDKIPLTEDLLKDIRINEKEYNLPQDVKKVLIFIKSVIKFIKDQGITPIEEMNKIFEGSAEDISKMDYIGEEFLNDEKKKLKIIAPGYKYKDLIISIPKVEEVIE